MSLPTKRQVGCFNSKLVRLKVEYKEPVLKTTKRFQFQIGAIKSAMHYRLCDPSKYCFNSKLVRLEDSEMLINTNVTYEFQFQTGAIRSYNESGKPHVNYLKFQFQTGAIRSQFI